MLAVTSVLIAALAGTALAIPVQLGNSTVGKRAYTNERFTWYDVTTNAGACGTWNKNTDIVSTPRVVLDEAPYKCFFTA